MNIKERHLFERIEDFMFSRKFVFIGTLSITIPLTVNLYKLYYIISPVEGSYLKVIYALSYAFALAIAVLIFTFHYIKYKPLIFAMFILVAETLLFDPFAPADTYQIRLTKIFLCVFGAYAAYSYAELYAKKAIESRKKQVNKPVLEVVDGENGHENRVNNDVDSQVFTCLECDKEFSSVKALNGHMVAHRSNKSA